MTVADTTSAEYSESTQKMLETTLSAVLDRPGYKPGAGAAEFRAVIADELYALGVIGQWSAQESRFLEWMAGWDAPTIASFLTVVRRAALS